MKPSLFTTKARTSSQPSTQSTLEPTDTLAKAALDLLINFAMPAIVFYLALGSSEPWSPASLASFFPESFSFCAFMLWWGCCCDLWFFLLRSFSSLLQYFSTAFFSFIEMMFSAMDGGNGIGGSFAKVFGPLFALILIAMAITLLQAAAIETFGEETVRLWANIILFVGLTAAALYPVVKFIGIIQRIASLARSRQSKTM